MGRLALTLIGTLIIAFGSVACERQDPKKADSSSVQLESAPILPPEQPVVEIMDRLATAPKIARLRLTPQQPRKGDVLTVSAEAESGKDDTATFRYLWKLNDELMREVDGPLFTGPFKKGDRVEVEVVPVAGGVNGVSLRQYTVIGNTPPIAKAKLVNAITSLTGYTAFVQAEDPDGDRLNFILLKGPGSMKIDSETGMISLDLQGVISGTYDVSVSIKDIDGAEAIISIPFTVEVAKSNTENQSRQ